MLKKNINALINDQKEDLANQIIRILSLKQTTLVKDQNMINRQLSVDPVKIIEKKKRCRADMHGSKEEKLADKYPLGRFTL